MSRSSYRPLRIALSDERRCQLSSAVQRFLAGDYELEISDFQARGLLDQRCRS